MSLRQPPIDHGDVKSTDFGGWEMPVEFDSIREEHGAVREAAGTFDVSHMGEITVSGPDAADLLQRLTTNDVFALDPGGAQYAAITDENGIMLDDTMVYHLPAAAGEDYLFIPNAGHDEEMTARWRTRRDEWDMDATVRNATGEYGMIALQGPESHAILDGETDLSLAGLPSETIVSGSVAGVGGMVATTGYTGETGFEILCPFDRTQDVWDALDCQPCGLGARDTLRLEMGFLLSGQEFDPAEEPRTPFEAGIEFAVALETQFVGRGALQRVDEEGPEQKLTGLVFEERGIPRHGYEVQSPDGEHLGHVTSGTMSPTLGDPIALAYLPATDAGDRNSVEVVVRGEPKKAHTRTPPFLN